MDAARVGEVRLEIVLGDITQLDVDAVVNAANSRLAGGGGVDGAIHRAAGRALDAECTTITRLRGRIPTGQAVATGAFGMRAKHIIHAVGPVYRGDGGDEELLRSAYQSSLAVADSLGVASIAFPAISTGAYGYPARGAAEVAVNAVIDYLQENPGTALANILFVLFDEGSFEIYRRLFDETFGE